MACIENSCRACDHVWFDNGGDGCPKCGADNPIRFFDEYNLADEHEQEEDHVGD